MFDVCAESFNLCCQLNFSLVYVHCISYLYFSYFSIHKQIQCILVAHQWSSEIYSHMFFVLIVPRYKNYVLEGFLSQGSLTTLHPLYFICFLSYFSFKSYILSQGSPTSLYPSYFLFFSVIFLF